ncbi:sensor histidine kinase [Bacillus alkalicellulosilyticus]|uniref:sensor histidine kinase n=1 Tax=Alkalihalobacterium alkalicellulosilyticum TaxID=1912214 RepID=UPI000997BBE1|nr:sensor histidine kinase [Bacillus alkalicellulosilyticus]
MEEIVLKRKLIDQTLTSILIVISTILIIINLQYPLVGIYVKVSAEEEVLVSHIADLGLASKKNIEINDKIVELDGNDPLEHPLVEKYNIVEQVSSMTIQRLDEVIVFDVHQSDLLGKEAIFYFLFPAVYFLLVCFICLFQYYKVEKGKKVIIGNYLLLLTALGYISATLSSKQYDFAVFIMFFCMLLSPVLLLHYIYVYIGEENKKWLSTRVIRLLYGLTSLVFLSLLLLQEQSGVIILSIFIILFSIIMYYLFKGFLVYKRNPIKVVFQCLIFAVICSIGPLIIFFALPYVVFGISLISGTLASAFLVAMPLVFVYMIGTNTIHDVQLKINRYSYYMFIALLPTLLITLIYKGLIEENVKLDSVFQFIGIIYVIILFSFLSQRVIERKVRTSIQLDKDSYQESIYRIGELLKKQRSVQDIIEIIKNEIQTVLKLEDSLVVSVSNKSHIVCSDNQQMYKWKKVIKKIQVRPIQIGKVIDSVRYTYLFIGEVNQLAIAVFLRKEDKTTLNDVQMEWLSTLAYYTSISLENVLKVEELIQQLDSNKRESHLVNRLLIKWSEKERSRLAIDIHDTVLQELLIIKRKIEDLKESESLSQNEYKGKVVEIEESILDSIYVTRETCHELRPPFLKEFGLRESLNDLLGKFQLRSNIEVSINWPEGTLENEECELAIFRVIQELLTNAEKHSKALWVEINGQINGNQLLLQYKDNGIGLQKMKPNSGLGLLGMKERIESLEGTITMSSKEKQGLTVNVCMPLSR